MEKKIQNERLLLEVANGNIKGIKEALRLGADINFINEQQDFALKIAASDDKYFTVAKLLIKRSADVNLWNENVTSALMVAAEKGCIKIVRLLLYHGASVEFKGERQYRSALMHLCSNTTTADSIFFEIALQLLKYRANVNLQHFSGTSALMIACSENNVRAVDFLLRHGANVNLQNRAGENALIIACKKGHAIIVEHLLKCGVVDAIADSEGKTALVTTYELSQRECGRLLLECSVAAPAVAPTEAASLLVRACREGSDGWVNIVLESYCPLPVVNMADTEGNTPLTTACAAGNAAIVELLLDHEATDVNMKNSKGMTPLRAACEAGNQEIVQLLLDNVAVDVNVTDTFGERRTALMVACESGNQGIVQLLASKGALLNLQDCYGQSALMIACEKGWAGMVQELLQYQLQVNLPNKKGKTALMKACVARSLLTVKLLLDRQADVDLQDNCGKSALMVSCENGATDIAKELLEYEARVDLPDNEGMTALMRACEAGVEESVQLLLEHNAHYHSRDNEGNTALIIACKVGNEAIVDLLLNHTFALHSTLTAGQALNLQDIQGNCKTALMVACENGQAEIAGRLLKHGADVDGQDKEGRTALMMVGEHRIEQNVRQLLSEHADVNLQDIKGRTALMRFCEEGRNEFVVQLLLNHGAKVDLWDREGNTALMDAHVNYWSEGVQLLLCSGAQVDIQDKKGRTALMKFCEVGDDRSVKLLLHHGAQVNMWDDKGRTALMIACEIGAAECIELLLKHGAHFDLQDPERLGTLSKGKVKSITEIADVLVKTGIKASKHSGLVYNGTEIVQVGSTEHLMAASRAGNKDKIEQLLSDGAEIDSTDSKGRTALITASSVGRTTVTDLLLERGAHIDSQDHQGNSALMSACQNGHVETTSYLLHKDADTFLKNSDGKTAFDLAIESRNTELLSLFTKLRSKPAYPGILFLGGPKRDMVTTKEKTIDLKEVGLSLSIPENSLPSTEEELQLEIQPCFSANSGAFDVPQDVELVSPAYIVKSDKKAALQKEVLVKMWHHSNLETEEDCEDMVFLSASASPESREGTPEPVYTFREIKEAKGSFRPGEEQPAGQIALLVLLFCMLALGKRKRENNETVSEGAKQQCSKGHLYSARLYKAVESKVFFCICLYHPKYMKECNEVMAILHGTPNQKLGPIKWSNGVQITSTQVRLTKTSGEEWGIMVKEPAWISKDEISAQETFEIADLLEMDYPPRIEVAIQRVPTSPDSGPLCLRVEGLNPESIFELLPDDFSQQLTVDATMIKCAVSDLKDEIQVQTKKSNLPPALLPTASKMVTMMESIEKLLQCSNDHDSALQLMVQLDDLKRKSQQLVQDAILVLSCLKVKCDLDGCVERVNTYATQMREIYIANLAHRNTSKWQSAVDLLVVNAANLMKAIRDTLKASKLACEIPNNVSPSTLPLEAQPVASSANFQPHPLSLSSGGANIFWPQPYSPKLANAPSVCEPRSQPLSSDLGNAASTCQPQPLPPRPAVVYSAILPQPVPPSLGVAPSTHFLTLNEGDAYTSTNSTAAAASTTMCTTFQFPPELGASSETLQSVPHDIGCSSPISRAAIVQQRHRHVCTNSAQPKSTKAKGLPSFPEVTSYLRKLDNVKLYDLAGELGLNVTDLRNRVSVENLPPVLCERWLREDDDVQTRSGDPSWSSLVTAMHEIGANGLARKIEEEKINLVQF